MKYRAILLVAVCCCALRTDAQELPLLGQLPILGPDWVLQGQGSSPRNQNTKKKGTYENAWVTFTNSKSGDIMSFAGYRYANISSTVGGDPMRAAASDLFPDGLPRFMLDAPPMGTVIEIRSRVITLETWVDKVGGKNLKAEALEYSNVYEGATQSAPNRLGHGYALAFGDTVIFVQHTSTHIITFEDAMATAISILRNHVGHEQ